MIEQPHSHSRSAWSVSLLLHVCLLLGGALLGVLSPRAMPLNEQARPASIVLRKVTSSDDVEYFDSQDSQPAAEGAESPQSIPLEQVLPPALESVPLAELPVPDTLGPLVSPLDVTLDTAERRTAAAIRSGDDQAVIEADKEAQRRRAAGRPSGPPAEVSLFGSAAATGHRFVFLIDRSQSMGGDGLGVLEAADGQLAGALERLQENHSFQIIAYNDHLDRFPKKGLATADAPAKAQAMAFVRGLAAFRGTEHGLALLAAAHTPADVIFLLTDGGYPEPAAYEMREVLQQCTGRSTVHALQFGFGPVQQKTVFMQTLAERTGGSYQYVDVSRW